jgi:hypothetical protein
MKRIIALAFPFLVLASVVITFAALEARRMPDWETTLSDYIAWSRLPDETIKVQAVVEASKPWNFRATMGKAVRNDWRWGIEQLPFPPTAMRCVLLERERKSAVGVPGEPKHQVIFVGYHTDTLWRVGWLVHEGPQEGFTPELVADLDTIGCDLDLK